MTNPQDSEKQSEEEKAAREFVETNMSWDDYECRWIEAGIKAYLAGRKDGIEWERKRLLGVVENIQNANKPFTMAGIIERESILHTFRQELGAFDEKKAQPTEGGE